VERHHVLISFSGLDGAGKSTLIRSLRTALAGSHGVVVCHMNHDIGMFAVLRALRNRLRVHGQAPAKPGGDESRHHSSLKRLRDAVVWNKPCRRLIYLADLLIFLIFRLYVEKVTRRILIMDRYFYDTLVDVAGPHSWAWLRLLAWLTPTPTVAVLLDTSPEEAFARKGEFSIDYLRGRSVAYRRVFRWVPDAVVLNPVNLARTTSSLEHLVTERARAASGRTRGTASVPTTRLTTNRR
jgi:thymidylate kinase